VLGSTLHLGGVGKNRIGKEQTIVTIWSTEQPSGPRCSPWRVRSFRATWAFRDGVEPEIGAVLDVLLAIHSETDALPIGKERSLWSSQALARQDLEIKAVEQRWHDRAITAATQLIHLIEQ
jgi:hypothetical protein